MIIPQGLPGSGNPDGSAMNRLFRRTRSPQRSPSDDVRRLLTPPSLPTPLPATRIPIVEPIAPVSPSCVEVLVPSSPPPRGPSQGAKGENPAAGINYAVGRNPTIYDAFSIADNAVGKESCSLPIELTISAEEDPTIDSPTVNDSIEVVRLEVPVLPKIRSSSFDASSLYVKEELSESELGVFGVGSGSSNTLRVPNIDNWSGSENSASEREPQLSTAGRHSQVFPAAVARGPEAVHSLRPPGDPSRVLTAHCVPLPQVATARETGELRYGVDAV